MRNTRANLWLAIVFTAVLLPLAATAQPKRPVTAATQFRSITVVTEPGASVWIDGVLYGKADKDGSLAIRTVTTGGHKIRVRADGFKQKDQPLSAAQKGEIKVPLVKTDDEAELTFQEAERLGQLDREKAVAAYKKAVKLRPAYPEAFLAMARTQADMGDLEDALKSLAAARKLRPGYAEASAVEGRVQREYGEDEKAIALYKRAITEGKGFQPEAYTGLGLLYKERAESAGGSGNFDDEQLNYNEAAKNLKLSIKQLAGAPDAMVIMQLLGLIYERQQKLADAIAVYEEFLRIFPDSNEATAVRSFVTQLRKQLDGQ
ncbi:MAG: tetratricopeptide repeat protein [Pyrinomonadaceae bacterium]|nr:tetratricopeptide repeat protein [Pyrinomonadaceae bacterium]